MISIKFGGVVTTLAGGIAIREFHKEDSNCTNVVSCLNMVVITWMFILLFFILEIYVVYVILYVGNT